MWALNAPCLAKPHVSGHLTPHQAVHAGLLALKMCAVSMAGGERSLGIYKAYYWMTTCLVILIFVLAAWFVCLVAVNTTGAPRSRTTLRRSNLQPAPAHKHVI